MTTRVSLHDLRKSLDEGFAHRDLLLALEDGEVLAVVGPQGGGRATLLGPLFAALGRPYVHSGYAYGARIAAPRALVRERPARRVPRLAPPTVYQLLAAAHTLRGQIDPPELRTFISMELIGLGLEALVDRFDAQPDSLDAEHRAMLPVLEVLMHDPALVGLDDPTAGLEDAAAEALLALIAALAPRRTVIVTTHSSRHARRIADRVALLVDGRLERCAPAAEYFDAPPTAVARSLGAGARSEPEDAPNTGDDHDAPTVLVHGYDEQTVPGWESFGVDADSAPGDSDEERDRLLEAMDALADELRKDE